MIAVLGTAIVIGEIRAVIAIPLALAAFLLKISQEEKWLRERFGFEYLAYQQKVNSLIPLVF